MEATQRMGSPPGSPGGEDADEDNYEDANASVLYARLTVVDEAEDAAAGDGAGDGGAETAGAGAGAVETGGQRTFDVYGGENRIGRDPDECNIVIHNKVPFWYSVESGHPDLLQYVPLHLSLQTLSRVHAILEIDDVSSMFIQDNHSLNKTYRNKMQLKPEVHYALEGGETIVLGEVKLKFEVVKAAEDKDEQEKEKKEEPAAVEEKDVEDGDVSNKAEAESKDKAEETRIDVEGSTVLYNFLPKRISL